MKGGYQLFFYQLIVLLPCRQVPAGCAKSSIGVLGTMIHRRSLMAKTYIFLI